MTEDMSTVIIVATVGIIALIILIALLYKIGKD